MSGHQFREVERFNVMAFDGSSESVQFTDAIFADGVLRPLSDISLRENEQVRLLVTRSQTATDDERRAALLRLFRRMDAMSFRSSGPYPMRDELHDRR